MTILSVNSSGYGLVDGPGIDFASFLGNKIHFNVLSNYDGFSPLPKIMIIYVSDTPVASVTFNDPYLGTPFVFERIIEGVSVLYCANMIDGELIFND